MLTLLLTPPSARSNLSWSGDCGRKSAAASHSSAAVDAVASVTAGVAAAAAVDIANDGLVLEQEMMEKYKQPP